MYRKIRSASKSAELLIYNLTALGEGTRNCFNVNNSTTSHYVQNSIQQSSRPFYSITGLQTKTTKKNVYIQTTHYSTTIMQSGYSHASGVVAFLSLLEHVLFKSISGPRPSHQPLKKIPPIANTYRCCILKM